MQLIKETKVYRCESEAESDKLITDSKEKFDVVKTTATLKTKKKAGEIIDSWIQTEIVINYDVE